MQISVLVIDLVGYSERLAALEEQVSNAGETLNRQIEEFVGAAVSAARLELADTVLKFTGDGAILEAPDTERAHRVALALQSVSAEFNRERKTELGKRVFRVGIASGEVAEFTNNLGNLALGGSTIGRAARMEAGCTPGSVMIDEASFRALPTNLQVLYQSPETVIDKNKAEYTAYRLRLDNRTRLQKALQKSLDELSASDNTVLSHLLRDLPFAKDVPNLLRWVTQPGNSAADAIEKLRAAVISLPKQRPIEDASLRLTVLLFLVCAEGADQCWRE